MLIRKITRAHSKTPVDFLYLEMGCVPLKNIIQSRRIMYLHYLLNRNENNMIYKCLKAQMNDPKKNDWYSDVENDLKMFKIDSSCEELKMLSNLI